MRNKYLQIFKTHLQRTMAYRLRVVIWVITDSLHLAVFPFLWLSIYGAREVILGYQKGDIITYYIIIAFISLVASSHVSRVIREDIMGGNINGLLLKPANYVLFRFLHECAYRLLTGFPAILILGVIAIFVSANQLFAAGWLTWLLFILGLACSFLLATAIQFIIGLPNFWLGETTSIQQIKTLLETVFSGQIAPLIFFPKIFQTVADWLPFKYLAYFPAQIFLRQLTTVQIIHEFAVLLAWIASLWAFVAIIWRRGLRRFNGVGI